jgi:lysine 2,3-aminomutase
MKQMVNLLLKILSINNHKINPKSIMEETSEKEFLSREADTSADEKPPSAHGINSPTILINNPSESITASQSSKVYLQNHFPEATEAEWNDWHWQISNSITSSKKLGTLFALSEAEQQIVHGYNDSLPLRITPYYASLIDKTDSLQPLRRTVIPTADEMILSEGEASDPLNEEEDSPLPNIVHRYPDRLLLLATGFCSTYCRYCTRSHKVAKQDKMHFSMTHLEPAFQYIESHTEIRDVLLSGGDPLTMSDRMLEQILMRLKSIPHIEFIRIGTKVPVVMPQRITASLTALLKRFHPLYLSIHFTHPHELTEEVKEACKRLADAGIPLGSQTVLLKGINDNIETMKSLMHGLLKIRVRPYYIYQCDPIPGSKHFRTPVGKGLEIIQGLRGFTSGYAVPAYVIDAPGGGGKIPLLPEYYLGREGDIVLLKNYEGKIFRYPDNSQES